MKPSLFVGSSSEGLDIAHAIQASLDSFAEVTVWDQDVFRLTEHALESLLRTLEESDFGIFVFSADDVLRLRGTDYQTARDNVVFELGLAIGALGRERSFILRPAPGPNDDFRLPSDLHGISFATYDSQREQLHAALGPAVQKFRAAMRAAKPRGNRQLVFYAPTIKSNSFFSSLIDYAVDKAKEKGFQIAIEKGNLEQFHAANNYCDVIQKYSGTKRVRDTVIVMIPPNPESLPEIWKLEREGIKANVITLDVDPLDSSSFKDSSIHKVAIVSDNEKGAQLACDEVLKYCRKADMKEINVIICEGNLHARGRMFREFLDTAAKDRATEHPTETINYLGDTEERSFSDAVKRANIYLDDILNEEHEALRERPTFVFCANDNMAIGARMAISNHSAERLAEYKDIRIICYDASAFVTMHIDRGDRFLWRAVDQRYTEFVNAAVEAAAAVLDERPPIQRRVLIAPEIYKR